MAVEAEGDGGGAGALALWGGWCGLRDGFLAVVVVVVAEGAAALEVAARWCAGLRFCDLGVVHCVRLGLFRLCARSGCERDGAAEVWWCADDFGTGGEGGKVAGKEGL